MKRILAIFFLCCCLQLVGNEIDTWAAPISLSTSGIDSSNPVVAMDSSGNSVAVWLEGGVVISKSKPFNSTWSSATTLSTSGASGPQLVVDPAGNATAIWNQSGVIQTRTKPFGSSWGSVVTLSAATSSSPQIAGDASGNLVAVWLTSGGVISKTKLFNMSWSLLADTLSLTGSSSPQVAVGVNGTVVAIWHTLNGVTSTFNVNAATKAIAGTWSSALLVSNPSTNSVYPNASVNSSGDVLAVWFSYNLNAGSYSNVILQSSATNLTTWATPVNVSNPGIRNPAGLVSSVFLSDAGNAVAVWTNSYNGSSFSVESSFGNFQLNWGGTVPIINSLYSYSIDIATNSLNDVLAVYMTSDTNSSPISIKYIESHAGGFLDGVWTTVTTISPGNSDSFPQLSTTISGNNVYGTAVWTNFDGMNKVVQSSFGTGTAVLPPTSPSVTQMSNNFGSFTEYFNVINWTASADLNLSGYTIYRNGVFVTFVSSSAVQFTDDNAVQNGAVIYGIAAFDNTGTESSIATVSFP